MHFIKKLELPPKILYLGLIPLGLNLISEFPLAWLLWCSTLSKSHFGTLLPSDHNYTLNLHLPREYLKIISSDKWLKLLTSLPRADTSKLLNVWSDYCLSWEHPYIGDFIWGPLLPDSSSLIHVVQMSGYSLILTGFSYSRKARPKGPSSQNAPDKSPHHQSSPSLYHHHTERTTEKKKSVTVDTCFSCDIPESVVKNIHLCLLQNWIGMCTFAYLTPKQT